MPAVGVAAIFNHWKVMMDLLFFYSLGWPHGEVPNMWGRGATAGSQAPFEELHKVHLKGSGMNGGRD